MHPNRSLSLISMALLLAGGCSAPPPESAETAPPFELVKDFERGLDDFVPVVLEADLASLDETDRKVLDLLVSAAETIEAIYRLQTDRANPRYRQWLESIPGRPGRRALEYFALQAGVYQRQRGWQSFVLGVPPRPPGAGFYPLDLSEEEIRAFLEEHPDREAELISQTTVIRRTDDGLEGVPYSRIYQQELAPAAARLREAARLTTRDGLRLYLVRLAEAIENDRWQQADMAWMDVDSPVALTLGPFEVYDDLLLGYKAAYEAFVTVTDKAATERMARLSQRLDAFNASLPGAAALDLEALGTAERSPVLVADLVFSAGQARAGIQPGAFNLPHDDLVRQLRGSRRVILRNVIEAKYEHTLLPLARQVLGEEFSVDRRIFTDLVLLHELAHGLGPGRARVGEQPVLVSEALLETLAPIEEAKADALGVWWLLELDRLGERQVDPTTVAATWLSGLLRTARFSRTTAQARAAMLNLGLAGEAGLLVADPARRRLVVRPARLRPAIEGIARQLLLIEATGDRQAARLLLERYPRLPGELALMLADLEQVPVDLRPIYPIAGEAPP